jgi:predicted DNA-binding transcriptional regulator AlpA
VQEVVHIGAQDLKRFLGLEEFAELLGLSPQTLYGYRYRHRLRPAGFPVALKVGNRLKYERADVERYLAELRAEAEADQSAGT